MADGLGLPMTVPEIPVDTPTADRVRTVVSIVQREAFEDAELRFDQIQPRCLGGRPDGMNSQSAKQREHARMIVNVLEVVEHHVEPLAAIAAPQPAKRVTGLADAFPLAKESIQAVG